MKDSSVLAIKVLAVFGLVVLLIYIAVSPLFKHAADITKRAEPVCKQMCSNENMTLRSISVLFASKNFFGLKIQCECIIAGTCYMGFCAADTVVVYELSEVER